MTFEATEIRALARTLDLTQKGVRQKASAIVRKATFAIERGSKLRAPVDTGNLRNSISTSLTGVGSTATGPIIGEVGPEASYGGFVEFGTWKMAPQPYLGPAFDELEATFNAAFDELAGKTLG